MGKALVLGLFLILGSDFVALSYRLYPQAIWLDMLFHFLGGAWLAGFFLWFFNQEKLQTNKFLWRAVLAISFVALVGVLWELAEGAFLNNLVIKIFGAQGETASLPDTLSDLALDLAGGLVLLLIYRYFKTYRTNRVHII